MVAEPKVIVVDPESELGRALGDAGGAPIVLQRGTTRFRLVEMLPADRSQAETDREAIWASYDPEAIRKGLEEVAGLITPEEGERMKEMIYRAREEGTRPIDRP